MRAYALSTLALLLTGASTSMVVSSSPSKSASKHEVALQRRGLGSAFRNYGASAKFRRPGAQGKKDLRNKSGSQSQSQSQSQSDLLARPKKFEPWQRDQIQQPKGLPTGPPMFPTDKRSDYDRYDDMLRQRRERQKAEGSSTDDGGTAKIRRRAVTAKGTSSKKSKSESKSESEPDPFDEPWHHSEGGLRSDKPKMYRNKKTTKLMLLQHKAWREKHPEEVKRAEARREYERQKAEKAKAEKARAEKERAYWEDCRHMRASLRYRC